MDNQTRTPNSADQSAACRCRKCQRELPELSYEHQERLEISFRAGYGSVFGDENVVHGVFCQDCVKDLLGPYLTVHKDDDRHQVKEGIPKGVYQAYQLPK